MAASEDRESPASAWIVAPDKPDRDEIEAVEAVEAEPRKIEPPPPAPRPTRRPAAKPAPPPPPSRPDDAPELTEFDELARSVEQRVREIGARVARAALAVEELTAREGGAAQKSEAAPSPAPPIPPPPEPKPEPEADAEPEPSNRPDINRITFEQLRDLGLSVTQAARLLARRDARGAYRSLEEIAEMPGFPRELIERLRRSLSV